MNYDTDCGSSVCGCLLLIYSCLLLVAGNGAPGRSQAVPRPDEILTRWGTSTEELYSRLRLRLFPRLWGIKVELKPLMKVASPPTSQDPGREH